MDIQTRADGFAICPVIAFSKSESQHLYEEQGRITSNHHTTIYSNRKSGIQLLDIILPNQTTQLIFMRYNTR